MIPLLQMKTADTAHTGIFASNTRPPFPIFGWGLETRLQLEQEKKKGRRQGGIERRNGERTIGKLIKH